MEYRLNRRTGDSLARTPFVPCARRDRDRLRERRDEQVGTEHVRGLHRVVPPVVRICQRERAHHGHSRARRRRGRRVEVRQQAVAEMHVAAEGFNALRRLDPRLLPVVPVVLLAPRLEEAEVERVEAED